MGVQSRKDMQGNVLGERHINSQWRILTVEQMAVCGCFFNCPGVESVVSFQDSLTGSEGLDDTGQPWL